MKKINFNLDWFCCPLGREEERLRVTLPHDAMRTEKRCADSLGEGNIGWFEGLDYEYCKTFTLPAELQNQHLELEFEGIYHDPEITVNGKPVKAPPYGYTDFSVDLDGLVSFDGENEIRVIAHNSDQPNSRWYSGTGIYRPVTLWHGPERRILRDGIRVTTLDAQKRLIRVDVKTNGDGAAGIRITDGEKTLARSEVMVTGGKGSVEMTVNGTSLWQVEEPCLYTARVTFGEDEDEVAFGIRALTWDAQKGMAINGERVVLRGACIHHDNGVLGACTYPEAEERRIRILKEAGYNAVRSAHNPASKYLLEACDRQGMLMMDEYVDCWYMHKTEHDYASHVKECWRDDLKSLVQKDYNHPSVIMYSTGNEVAESAQKQGIALQQDFTDYLHSIDPTRPVTCGINIFFNFLSSIGMGVYSDEKAEKQAKQAEKNAKEQKSEAPKKKKKSVGSEFFNNMAAKLGTDFMKFGAWLPPCDWKTRDVFAAMDVAGYNYGNWRYRKDCRKYPDRLILGSETLIGDARPFWLLAKDHPQIIGDFVWAGWDYIGECGGDSPEYGSWRTDKNEDRIRGGTCRIDVTGKMTPEADYTRVVFDIEKRPRLAVIPPSEDEKPVLTGWQLARAHRSWSWPGCEGKQTQVEVYSTAEKVRLTLNGKEVGTKKVPASCRVLFSVPYEAGTLRAENLPGGETDEINSAAGETVLRIEAEKAVCAPGEMVYLRLRFTDSHGETKPLERDRITVNAQNAEVVGTANAATFFEGNYAQSTVPAYFGEAQAVIRAGHAGKILVTAAAGDKKAECEITCKE